jgi:hypothetical protein
MDIFGSRTINNMPVLIGLIIEGHCQVLAAQGVIENAVTGDSAKFCIDYQWYTNQLLQNSTFNFAQGVHNFLTHCCEIAGKFPFCNRFTPRPSDKIDRDVFI